MITKTSAECIKETRTVIKHLRTFKKESLPILIEDGYLDKEDIEHFEKVISALAETIYMWANLYACQSL